MSVRVMSAVWAMDLPAKDKLVLLALADCANDEGIAWPSIATLARKCGCDERTIQRNLRGSELAGIIRREEVPGRGNRYHFNPRQMTKGAGQRKGADVGNTGGEMQGYHPPQHHYVYRTEQPETGEFYIGARSCVCDPESGRSKRAINSPKRLLPFMTAESRLATARPRMLRHTSMIRFA
jgi:hypothetical protein